MRLITQSKRWNLSSDARCSTPCRFDIGSVDQDLRECCDASLFTSVGRGKRSNRRHEGGRPLDLRHLQRAKSTVSRELRRNALPSGRYSPLHAAGAYQLRRRREAILEKDPTLRTFVRDRLAEGWAPEQIAGWLKAGNERGLRALGFEAIYALHLSRRPQGRGPLALSDAPPQ